MTLLESKTTRRQVLKGAVAAAVLWTGRSLFKPLFAQQSGLLARPVAQVPTDPTDALWGRARATRVPMNPQNLVLPRVAEAGANEIVVRALYDSDRLGVLVEWRDAHKDTDLGTVLQYRDAVAVQLPEDPSQSVPAFTMGQEGNAVLIYHWKSDWQFSPQYDVDEAYPNMHAAWYQYSGVAAGEMPEAEDYLSRGRKEFLTAAAVGNVLADPRAQERIGPVQKMRAEGFGRLEPHPDQDAAGSGVWADGVWRIAISLPRKQEKFRLADGDSLPLAFAVWDGSRDERNGQKAYSAWNTLRLGAVPAVERKRGAPGWLVPFFSSVWGAIIAVLLGALGLDLWRGRRHKKEQRGSGEQ